MGIGCPIFCIFSFTPNPITSAQHGSSLGTGALFFYFSESGRGGGAQLLLMSFVTTRLHGICNKSNNGMEDGDTLQSHCLGTGDKCPPSTPNLRVLFGTGSGHKSVLSSANTLQEILNPINTSPGHTRSPICAPTATFSFSRIV